MPTSWWVTPLDLRKITRTLWSTQLLHTLARFTKQKCTGDCYSNNFTPRYRKSRNSCVHLRYLTRLTYIFLKNSSNFRRRRRQISAQAHLDFPHDSAWKNLGRDSAQIRVESGESKSRTYVQSLVKLSQLCWRTWWYMYRTSSEGIKVTVINAVQGSTILA